MKFSTLALALFAVAGLAAPVADAEADANANAVAEADPTFLSLLAAKLSIFNLGGICSAPSVSVGTNAGIFITPDRRLIYGNTIAGSVAFRGSILNGNLFANCPFFNNGLGCVNYGDDGRLYLQDNFPNPLGWYSWNQQVLPHGQQVYGCPDDHGNHYLYFGGNRHNQFPVSFTHH